MSALQDIFQSKPILLSNKNVENNNSHFQVFIYTFNIYVNGNCNCKSNQVFNSYSLYYAKACNELAGAHLRVIAPGQHSVFRRNVIAVESRWQHCVQFDRPETSSSDLPLQRPTRYRSINWPVFCNYILIRNYILI